MHSWHLIRMTDCLVIFVHEWMDQLTFLLMKCSDEMKTKQKPIVRVTDDWLGKKSKLNKTAHSLVSTQLAYSGSQLVVYIWNQKPKASIIWNVASQRCRQGSKSTWRSDERWLTVLIFIWTSGEEHTPLVLEIWSHSLKRVQLTAVPHFISWMA